MVFAGPATVIVFFMISGSCIHTAHHKEAKLKLINYYASRPVRLGLPLAAILIFVQPLSAGQDYVETVLWSLYCELVYYAMYPFLRPYFLRLGEMILVIALAAAAMVALTHLVGHSDCDNLRVSEIPSSRYGIVVRRRMDTRLLHSRDSAERVQAWCVRKLFDGHNEDEAFLRLDVKASVGSSDYHEAGRSCLGHANYDAGVAASEQAFGNSEHTPDVLLPIFQSFAAIWITAETITMPKSQVWTGLAAMGAWSYSLYLCHKFTFPILSNLGYDNNAALLWFVQIPVALFISYGFYRGIERPSHFLAQRLRKHVRGVPTLSIL